MAVPKKKNKKVKLKYSILKKNLQKKIKENIFNIIKKKSIYKYNRKCY
jgi:hypothetical protein